MQQRLIECVPNFSEGRDMNIIKQITDQIETVEGVQLLDVDPGKATNRTVVTMVGTPEKVIEAAFLAIKKAGELIDMSKHTGEHPRMGATDVCPLIPVSGMSMEETTEYAKKLAERVGRELDIPIYLYEYAASAPYRKNLANIRAGEYEGFSQKMQDPKWKPDFGPTKFNVKSGATVIGARDFLIAYNINLNSTSTRRANSIAFDVREKGRVKRDGNPVTGKIVTNEKGETVYIPGSLKEVKAIGWFIEEYGIAQISMNLTNITVTPVHIAFEEVCKKAQERGIRVTGSELVGLIPLNSMLDAGKYFLKKQKRSTGVPEKEIIKIAVKSMGLDELGPFDPDKKIIEYVLRKQHGKELAAMSLKSFSDETSSESPAPGGGSIAAYMGTLGAALGTMVANLSSHKKGWDDRWEEFSNWAEKGQALKNKLLHLVDEDTHAFNQIMAAYQLPNSNETEKNVRKKAITDATKYAIEIPYQVMEASYNSMNVIKKMAEIGLPSSVSDAGVGALCARSAVYGAYLNVKINLKDLNDKDFKESMTAKSENLLKRALEEEKVILDMVRGKIEK